MRDDAGEPAASSARGIAYPGTVLAAGIVWIVFGCPILLGFGIGFIGMLRAVATHPPAAGELTSFLLDILLGTLLMLLGILLGGGFIYVGAQSVRGTVRGTLGYGIGSIILGLLSLGFGGRFLVIASAEQGLERAISEVFGWTLIIAGAGPFLAGGLALVGRSQYRMWRQAQKDGMPRGGA
jgi:hypothetical protein